MIVLLFAALLHAGPAAATVPPAPSLVQSRASVERLLAQRVPLGLTAAQIVQLRQLSAAATQSEIILRNSSKPWVTAHAVLRPAQVEAQALAVLDAAQRPRAAILFRDGGSTAQ